MHCMDMHGGADESLLDHLVELCDLGPASPVRAWLGESSDVLRALRPTFFAGWHEASGEWEWLEMARSDARAALAQAMRADHAAVVQAGGRY